MISKIDAAAVVEAARQYLGAPFKLHGKDKRGIDCIGLIIAVAKDFGLVVNNIPDYGLAGMKFRTAENLLLTNGCVPVDVKRVQPGDIFTAQNLLTGAATGTGIVSGINGNTMFSGLSAIIHCETVAFGYSKPRMRVVEDRLGTFDVMQARLSGVSAETIARALRFYAYPFMAGDPQGPGVF